MNHRAVASPLLSLILILLTIVACAAPSSTPPPTLPAPTSIPPSSTPIPPTPTAVPPAPTATQILPTPTPATMPKAGETWRLVVLGDFQSFGFGETYARQIETDLGVKVELDDLTSGGYTPANLLNDLRNGTGSRMGIQSAVKQADVVVFSFAPLGIIEEQPSGQLDCSAKALAGYRAALDSAYAEIFALRKGQPTLIRTKDYFCNFYGEWKKAGKYDDHMRCWEAWNGIIHQAAAEHKVPVAEVFAAFNGPSHEQDPLDKGLQDANGLPNEAGNKLIADQFRKLGYHYVIP